MKCDFQASLLARTFESPCFGREPKARVATILQHFMYLLCDEWPTCQIHYRLFESPPNTEVEIRLTNASPQFCVMGTPLPPKHYMLPPSLLSFVLALMFQ